MYSSHSSVRFTSTRAPNNYCLSRTEQCSALTKAGFLKVCPRYLSLFLLRGEIWSDYSLPLPVLISEGWRTVSLPMTCFSFLSSKSSSSPSSLESLSEESSLILSIVEELWELGWLQQFLHSSLWFLWYRFYQKRQPVCTSPWLRPTPPWVASSPASVVGPARQPRPRPWGGSPSGPPRRRDNCR